MLLINAFHFNCLCVQISAVRLPREPSNPERLKGFGYAEFDDVESLLRALNLSEEVREPEVGKDTIKQSETFTKVQEGSVNNSCNKLLLCSCQQNLGNRRIRVDIADQSNDKGTLLFLDILIISASAVTRRSIALVEVFDNLTQRLLSFFTSQKETADLWVVETEVGEWLTWVLTRQTVTGELDQVRMLMMDLPGEMMPSETVSLICFCWSFITIA